ncbi:histone H3 [Striga asiatica]|uniref:Histone H3 n=1 Tax=Striga asiatica TaxID=4170 RepID=A0A5A7QC49_STRAF|nr:histone H3 [Striga asiatica]
MEVDINQHHIKSKSDHPSTSSTLASNTPRQLDVLRHNRDPLGVNSAQIRVLEETHEVGLGRFLQSQDGVALKPQICLEILRNLTNQTLERELPDQELRALLVLSDFTVQNRKN